MQISDTTLQLQLPSTSSADKLLQNLRPGQTLQATTLTTTVNGTMQLQIGKLALTAQTNINLPLGSKLTLRVDKGGELPQLQILTALNPKPILQQTTVNTLPRQQPLQPLFQNLTTLLASGEPLPPPLKALAGNFMESILTTNDPAFSKNIKAAVERSGPFLESHLANGQPPKQDLKATLIKMIQMLKPLLEYSGQMYNGKLISVPTTTTSPALIQSPLPPNTALPTEQLTLKAQNSVTMKPEQLLRVKGEQAPIAATNTAPEAVRPNALLQQLVDLFKSLEGSLARIQLHQVASLQSEEINKNVWQLELPIRHADRTDTFEMRIEERREESATKASHTWSVTIKFDLQPLGPMHANLMLSEGEQLSTIFWAEHQDTLKLIHSNLPKLRSSLERTGLKIERIEAFQGEPPKSVQPQWQTTLVDEKA